MYFVRIVIYKSESVLSEKLKFENIHSVGISIVFYSEKNNVNPNLFHRKKNVNKIYCTGKYSVRIVFYNKKYYYLKRIPL